ncbi:MAG TPA: tetratricopeptide repeat protein, partial [Saprospiraceae bacterium]|nr:tetratricopeptide repeat protein [Saprospiraceae bacterium]
LEEDAWFPPSLRDELATAEANLWIKQKKYDRAIPALTRAIEMTPKKKRRARLAFILAQLCESTGRTEEAYAAYETVLNSRPAYVMDFNARLRQIQAGWVNGKMSSAEANHALDRMLKDDKNREYRDRIYYTLADIALRDGQKPEAIVFLRKSLDANSGDAVQRAESYLKLADLYFEGEDFVNAKLYYDSTLNVLPPTDQRHARVNAYAANLTDIARLIKTIAANDSIVRVYRMSDAERRDLAKKIKKQREAEAEAAAKAEADKAKATAGTVAKAPTPQAGQKQPSFYFYTESLLKKGRKDFNKAWGDRKLEDNWRRSQRPKTDAGEDVASSDTTRANQVSDIDLKNIFQGLPGSEAELAVLHLSTYEAMYNLGTLFRDKLQNNRRCSGTLEEVQTRYPDIDKFQKETWYYCYLAFTDLDNPVRAKYYLDKLVGKYPNSTYARALTDPNFLAAGKERERELNRYYEQTYTLFTTGGYKDAYDRCQEAPKKYGSQNALMPKFVLLSALCVGNLQGNDEYCKALAEVTARYPESIESTRAKEIARLLSCKGFEVPKEEQKPKPDVDDAFTLEDDKLHYFIVALQGDDFRVDDVKAAVSDYNREYHKLEQLRISNIFLGTETDKPVLVIRKFDNKEQAMRYYDEVKSRKEFLGEGKKAYNKELFAITQENYRRVLKNKTLDGYREFFQENYLKK